MKKFLLLSLLALTACPSNNDDKIDGVEDFGKIKGGDHREGHLQYSQNPPVGGPHNPVWQNCGVYDAQIPPENAVHSLEHGAVWIAYQPGLATSEIEKLRKVVEGRSYTLLAPYQVGALDHPVVAVAWGFRLQLDKADDPRLAKFISKYMNGPQTPEPGATCSGGNGVPIQ